MNELLGVKFWNVECSSDSKRRKKSIKSRGKYRMIAKVSKTSNCHIIRLKIQTNVHRNQKDTKT